MNRSAFLAATLAAVFVIEARAAETSLPAEGTAGGIEEVVVTALRRSESVQDVPVSITAFGAEAIRDMRVDDPTDLAQHVPNLSAASTLGGGAPIFALRGVSMNDYSPNQSSPVAMYTDEVYRGTPALMGPSMYDLERVEVLRGPQGTLYGKNTTGGADQLHHRANRVTTQRATFRWASATTSGGRRRARRKQASPIPWPRVSRLRMRRPTASPRTCCPARRTWTGWTNTACDSRCSGSLPTTCR